MVISTATRPPSAHRLWCLERATDSNKEKGQSYSLHCSYYFTRTTRQKAFVNIAVVFRPDEYQQDEQQGLEHHKEVEYLDLELVEADEVQHTVQDLEQDDAEVGQRETVVQDRQRVELGER